MAEWELEDVERCAQENPASFFIPTRAERRSQRIGDLVRLHFLLRVPIAGAPRAERMWVEVTQDLAGDGRYRGVLTNVPGFLQDVHQGDEIAFEPRHIARTLIKQGDPRWVDCAEQRAMVSEMAFLPGEMIRFAYRENPDHSEDSGWRLFTGHEKEDYVNDAKNIRLCVVGWLLDHDPSLDLIIREPAGSVFERRTGHGPWVRVTDWSPGSA